MRILVLGAGGMLGHTMFRRLGANSAWQVYGTLRSDGAKRFFPAEMGARLLTGVDVEHHDTLVQAFVHTRPDTVINCVGLIKQLAAAQDPLKTIPVNALLPHRLAGLCQLAGARLVHVSTDCVFSGKKGNYRETDPSDASDLYGQSKLLGEVIYPHTITLRTSMIGHELAGTHGLLGWFLAQQGRIKGYTRAVFSGLPTVELARVVRDVVLPRPELSGLYHVAGAPIAKY
ncbi:dTDP-4-dehydrorhamnose reductase family protein, partial [Desulfosarcina sp.]|uniref:dTDP-4-dehydrorhamnose reductase family protein n=1 Tax=Desulfosarcina sp. TaxID=2027861 RepID=UPI0039706276